MTRTPALLMRMSSRPNSATAASVIRLTSAGFETSTPTATARPPAAVTSSTTDRACPSSRSATATCAPSAASCSAIWRPRPAPAPVTMPTFPANRMVYLLASPGSPAGEVPAMPALAAGFRDPDLLLPLKFEGAVGGRRLIERLDRVHLQDPSLDPLKGQNFGGLETTAEHQARADESDVATRTELERLADLGRVRLVEEDRDFIAVESHVDRARPSGHLGEELPHGHRVGRRNDRHVGERTHNRHIGDCVVRRSIERVRHSGVGAHELHRSAAVAAVGADHLQGPGRE